MNKKIFILCSVFTSILVACCILNLPSLVLALVASICLSFVLVSFNEATYLIFYFSPLSYVFIYGRYNIYILIVVAYLGVALFRKNNVVALFPAFLMLLYCIIFASGDVAINIGRFIYPILLLALLFVCQYVEQKDYKTLFYFFLAGFMISIILSFFKEQLPLLTDVFGVDELYLESLGPEDHITRYSGLSYDPNFFTLIDCLAISALLFGEKKTGVIKGIVLIFLVVVGLFTFSKSYILLLAIIFISYLCMRSKAPIKTLVLIGAVLVCLWVIERYSDIRVLSLIEERFASAEDSNDLTTGRIDLWIEYIKYIVNDFKCLFVGEGFNALSLEKAAHNTYIEFIYRFGVVGSILWIIYFVWCSKEIARKVSPKRDLNVSSMVLYIGLFFLSAFHFQQLWCCIFLAWIIPYLEGGQDEKTKCDCSDLQCGKNTV